MVERHIAGERGVDAARLNYPSVAGLMRCSVPSRGILLKRWCDGSESQVGEPVEETSWYELPGFEQRYGKNKSVHFQTEICFQTVNFTAWSGQWSELYSEVPSSDHGVIF
jgi:hypothetical protein